VYAREIGGRTLTLAVAGVLWYGNLILIDEETESLWSQLLGEAEQGRLKGKKLRPLPSVLTDWESWRKQHPDGTVLLHTRTSVEFHRQFYEKGERFVLGVVLDQTARAWSFEQLKESRIVNDAVGGTAVLVTFDPVSATARLFARQLADRTLTFQRTAGGMSDLETGSTWDPATGQVLAGPLAGQRLAILPGVVSYEHVWRRFYPRSEWASPP